MLSLPRACLALALLMLAVSSASAQGIGSSAQSGPLLLMAPSVRQELNVDQDQALQLQRVMVAILRKYGRDLAQAAKQNDLEKVEQLRGKLNADAKKSIDKILKAEQKKRLHQIEMQLAGVRTLAKPEVAKELKLSDKQKEQINGISDELITKVKDLTQAAKDDPAKARTMLPQLQKLNKEATDKALGQLNEEQKKIWLEMTGKPFELKLLQGGGLLNPGGRP